MTIEEIVNSLKNQMLPLLPVKNVNFLLPANQQTSTARYGAYDENAAENESRKLFNLNLQKQIDTYADELIKEREEVARISQLMSRTSDNVNVIPSINLPSNIPPLLVIGGLILGAVLITR